MRFGRVAVLAWLAATAGTAEAHHPGSHAVREKDGRVRVEVAAAAADSCTAIASVRNVAPPRVTPPPATAPVTVQLQRRRRCAVHRRPDRPAGGLADRDCRGRPLLHSTS